MRSKVVTLVTGIVHQDDLRKKVVRRPVDDAVDVPQERTPRLVVIHQNNTCGGKILGVYFVGATAEY